MDILETDMRRWVYFSLILVRGKCVKGRDSVVLGGQQGRLPQGDSSLNPLYNHSGETVQGQWSLNSLGDRCAFVPRGLAPSALSEIAPCK